ncbi:hypothetical protein HN873_037542, partial [Arachis hypogaea]
MSLSIYSDFFVTQNNTSFFKYSFFFGYNKNNTSILPAFLIPPFRSKRKDPIFLGFFFYSCEGSFRAAKFK